MTLERFNPLTEFGKFFGVPPRFIQALEMPESWNIPLDVDVNTEDIIVTASLPGVKAENIDATVEDGVLTIKAKKEERKEENFGGRALREIRTGLFHRSIHLPDNVKIEEVTSTYKDGILKIILPKEDAVKPKKISIS